MPDYIALAHEHLQQAADIDPNAWPGLVAKHLAIAREYRMLAAIEKGLPPGCACQPGDTDPAKIAP